MSLQSSIRSTERGVDRQVDDMPRPRPAGEQRGEHVAVIVAGDRLLDERDAALVEQVRGRVSSGSMTTNFERSKPKWRSISGSVPLPIEPKPIITIGPAKRACSGHGFGHAGSARSYRLAPEQEAIRLTPRAARGTRRVAAEARRPASARSRLRAASRPVRADRGRARRRARRARARSASSRCALVAAGQPQPAGLLGREAEAAVVRRVADQQHGAMAAPLAPRAARAASAPRRCRGCGSPDAPRAARAAAPARPGPAATCHSRTVPTTRPSLDRDERQSVGRQAAFAQPLRRLGEAAGAVGASSSASRARHRRPFLANRDHGHAPPAARTERSSAIRKGSRRAGSRRCQMW